MTHVIWAGGLIHHQDCLPVVSLSFFLFSSVQSIEQEEKEKDTKIKGERERTSLVASNTNEGTSRGTFLFLSLSIAIDSSETLSLFSLVCFHDSLSHCILYASPFIYPLALQLILLSHSPSSDSFPSPLSILFSNFFLLLARSLSLLSRLRRDQHDLHQCQVLGSQIYFAPSK